MHGNRPFTLGTSLLAAWTLFACSTLEPPADPGAWVPMPMGTVSVFHRVSQGSYGVADGRVTWTHGNRAHEGTTYFAAASPQAGINLYDLATHRIAHVLTPAGQPVMSYDPPMGLRFPLAVGQRWTDEHRVTLHARGTTTPLRVSYTVEALETLTVPAGSFQAFRVLITDSLGEQTVQWTAPAQGQTIVKRVLDRGAGHPQGPGHLEGVLQEVRKPGN
jgi:hypothetical protein